MAIKKFYTQRYGVISGQHRYLSLFMLKKNKIHSQRQVMKKFLFWTFTLIFPFQVFSQNFSGDVQYNVRIVPKVAGLNVDSILALQPGKRSIYRIMDGYYKTTYFRDEEEVYSYTYLGDTKRMYDADPKKDYITFRDSRKANNVRIRSIIYNDSIKTILGHSCFMVERVYENYISKTYYAKDLKINPESFKDHSTGDWYHQIKEVNGALSLGSINEYAQYFEINEVVGIKPKKLNANDFALPSHKLVIASSYALDSQVELLPPTQDAINCYKKKIAVSNDRMANNKQVCYVGFICTSEGGVTHVEPYEEDTQGLHVIAVDIIKNCGFKFSAGLIEGKTVDSWVYFPVEFFKN